MFHGRLSKAIVDNSLLSYIIMDIIENILGKQN